MVAEEYRRGCNNITATKIQLLDYATSQKIANEISKSVSAPRGWKGGPQLELNTTAIITLKHVDSVLKSDLDNGFDVIRTTLGTGGEPWKSGNPC